MYDKGTIKLTTIFPNDYTILDSKMYDNLEDALGDAESLRDYLIFELEDVKGDYYRWKLLPYGSSKQFVGGMRLRDSNIAMFAAVGILGLAVYGLFKMIK